MEGEGLPALSFTTLSGNIYNPPTRDRHKASEGEISKKKNVRKTNEQEEKVREKEHERKR